MLARSIEILMPVKRGFHLRVLSRFVKCVKPFQSSVRIRKGNIQANGKSIMGLMALAAAWKSKLHIDVEGDDVVEAVEAIKSFFRKEAAAEIIDEQQQ